MTGRMQGKVVLVTGAGSVGEGWGNGKAAAVLYAREGAKVIACDINKDAVAETADIILTEGGDVSTIICDVRNESEVQAMFAQICDQFQKLDVLHNNVGIVQVGARRITEEDWDHLLSTNLKVFFSPQTCNTTFACPTHFRNSQYFFNAAPLHRLSLSFLFRIERSN